MSRTDDLVVPTDRGLWCDAGGFHIDPWKPVDRAVITHAHADHACAGCKRYLATPETKEILHERIGRSADVQPLPTGETLTLARTTISLHPAGHVLGSAQVRIQPDRGPTWVVTGDYKTERARACAPFEPVPCDVLLTESTFGLPIFRWPDQASVERDINEWWRANRDAGRTSVLLAWSLGKAQRVLASLDPDIGPIGVHGAVRRINRAYARLGVRLPEHVHAKDDRIQTLRGRGAVIAPPSTIGTPWMRKLAGPGGARTAVVSGWMRVRGRRRWQAVDRGFVMSDHADWPGLLAAIRESGAQRVGVTHGYASVLARYLEEQGLDAFVVPTRYEGESLTSGGDQSDDNDDEADV